MSKKLIPLAVLAGLLLLLGILKNLASRPSTLEDEMDLTAFAPEGFLASDVARIEIYRGSKEKDKVALVRDGELWVVESRFGAPGDREKIDKFLDKLKGLEGERRSDLTHDPEDKEAAKLAKEVLRDFGLADEDALHFVIFEDAGKEDGGKPAAAGKPRLHLLAGKKEKHGSGFVRKAGGDVVYTVDVNLASETGMWGDDATKAPESKEWIDKTVIDLDKDKVARIALTTPDRSVVFEKREKKDEKKDGEEEAKPGDGDKKKEYEWVVASGGPEAEFKKKGVEDILNSLKSYKASDVEDPAKKGDLGLDEPGFRCELSLDGGKSRTLLAAQKDEDSKKTYYMMLQGGKFIYKLDSWKFDDIFKESKDLFELKGPGLDKEKVAKVTLEYPDITVELVKEKEKDGDEKKWKMVRPDTGLELRDWEPKDVARGLAEWKPADYAVGRDLASCGLATPSHRASFEMEDGEKHTFALGDEAKGVEGRYALLDGGKQVWVSGKYDSENVFPKLKDFFKMDVCDIKDDEIKRIDVERDGDSFTIEKEGEGDAAGWKLTVAPRRGVAGEKVEHDAKKVKDYVGEFDWLSADGIALGPEAAKLLASPKVTVRVTAKKDDEDKGVTIRFGEETGSKEEGKDERRVAARVSGGKMKAVKSDTALLFDEADFGKLAPPSSKLRKPEEKKPPEAEAGGAAEKKEEAKEEGEADGEGEAEAE